MRGSIPQSALDILELCGHAISIKLCACAKRNGKRDICTVSGVVAKLNPKSTPKSRYLYGLMHRFMVKTHFPAPQSSPLAAFLLASAGHAVLQVLSPRDHLPFRASVSAPRSLCPSPPACQSFWDYGLGFWQSMPRSLSACLKSVEC